MIDTDIQGMSAAQGVMISDLMNKLRDLDPALYGTALRYMVRMQGHWTPGRDGNASRWIDRLIAKNRELKNARRAATQVTEGMYALDGQIFKVQRAMHGSGELYAKWLVPNKPGERATFAYVRGAINKLRPEHKLTLEQAREWGALYGTCVRCGAVLTDEDSIERMMGPICAGKI